MKSLQYHRPRRESELYELLAAETAPILWLAGGTDLLVQERAGRSYEDRAVYDLTALEELKTLREDGTVLELGALLTHGQIAASPAVQTYAPLLAQACSQVGACQLRNRATLGGNLCNASPAGDTLAPLAALNAEVELDCLGQRRRIAVTDLILSPGKTALREKEFVRCVYVPKLSPGIQSRFLKIGRRNAMAISRLTLSLVLNREADGRVAELRAAVGAVFPRPMRFPDLEESLRGQELTDEAVEAFAQALAEQIPAIAGVRESTRYKQPVCRMACTRLLKEMRDADGTDHDSV